MEEWLPLHHPDKRVCPEAPRRGQCLCHLPHCGAALCSRTRTSNLHLATFNPFFFKNAPKYGNTQNPLVRTVSK